MMGDRIPRQPGVIEQETVEPVIDDEKEQAAPPSYSRPVEVSPSLRTLANIRREGRQIS